MLYILEPIQLAVKGDRVDGSAVVPEERFDRTFRVEFLAQFIFTEGCEKRSISEKMSADLRIIVRDPTRE